MLKKTVTDIKPLREISLKSDKNDEYCLFSVRPGHIKEFKTTFLLIWRNFFPNDGRNLLKFHPFYILLVYQSAYL